MSMKKVFNKISENVRANMQCTFTRNCAVMCLGFTVCGVIMCVAASFLR